MSLLHRASRFAARHLACRWLPLSKGQGVVSFSFDDVPASACHRGAALLWHYQARGTFFVCGSLTDGEEQGQPCHSADDLRQLIGAGHEVACHTYSHSNCARTALPALQLDWDKNQDFFLTNGINTSGFAFPFGAYDFGSKLAAARRFSYSRITGGGTQLGRADLSALRAQPLYAAATSAATVQALIQRTAQEGGWLIFYAHEVCDQPGPWGTTPAQLEMALQLAGRAGCRILPLQKAIDFFQT